MDQNIMRLLQVLKDFVPELSNIEDEELYKYWKLWMESWHKGKLTDFISKQK